MLIWQLLSLIDLAMEAAWRFNAADQARGTAVTPCEGWKLIRRVL